MAYEPMQISGQNLAPAPLLNGIINDRPAFAHVDIDLQQGQQVLSDAGAMIWMDQKLDIRTDCGDCSPACWRHIAGESCCQNTYTGPGRIAFSFKLPGDMLPFGVAPNGGGWILNAGGFICGTTNIEVTSRFSSCVACTCGGENAFLTKIISKDGQPGMFYAGGYGAITRHEIPEGKTFCLDNGLFFAANEASPFELALPGGIVGWCYGREGFVMRFHGPAVIYSQNRDPALWRRLLKPRPARKDRRRQQGGAGAVMGAVM